MNGSRPRGSFLFSQTPNEDLWEEGEGGESVERCVETGGGSVIERGVNAKLERLGKRRWFVGQKRLQEGWDLPRVGFDEFEEGRRGDTCDFESEKRSVEWVVEGVGERNARPAIGENAERDRVELVVFGADPGAIHGGGASERGEPSLRERHEREENVHAMFPEEKDRLATEGDVVRLAVQPKQREHLRAERTALLRAKIHQLGGLVAVENDELLEFFGGVGRLGGGGGRGGSVVLFDAEFDGRDERNGGGDGEHGARKAGRRRQSDFVDESERFL